MELGLAGEEFLEGTDDLLWNPDWESVWAGFGHRSTRAAVDQFATLMESMNFEVRKLELVDPYFFHLNLCLAPLAAESLLIYPGAFAPETLAQIRSCAQIFEVPREEALQFVCNGVSVNGYYITPRMTRRLEQVLGREGIEPIVVNVSEFDKAGRLRRFAQNASAIKFFNCTTASPGGPRRPPDFSASRRFWHYSDLKRSTVAKQPSQGTRSSALLPRSLCHLRVRR